MADLHMAVPRFDVFSCDGIRHLKLKLSPAVTLLHLALFF